MNRNSRLNRLPIVSSDPFHTVIAPELRWMILKNLFDFELIRLRLVSKMWKLTIDSFLKVSVTIDGSEDGNFNGRCALSMKRCNLVALQKCGHKAIFRAMCPQEVHILYGISENNFRELLLQWTYLSKLEICWRSLMKNLLFDEKKSSDQVVVTFPNLTSLKIGVLTSDSLSKNLITRISANLMKITSFDYPALAVFQVDFVGYRELKVQERHLSVILPFMRKHFNSLESLQFTMKYIRMQATYPPIHPRHILFCVPTDAQPKPSKLVPYGASEVSLIKTKLERLGDSTCDNNSHEWEKMLLDSHQLEEAIKTVFLNWNIQTFAHFIPTIRTYCKFLTCIDLMNVSVYDSEVRNSATPLDFKIFSQGLYLQELRVFRAPQILHEDEQDPPTEIINLHTLPKTLRELVVDGLPVSCADILEAIKNLRELSSFTYYQSQLPKRNWLKSNGIDWLVLEAMLEHENLIYVHVHANPSLSEYNCQLKYDALIKSKAVEYGWNTNGLRFDHKKMLEVLLTKGNSFLK